MKSEIEFLTELRGDLQMLDFMDNPADQDLEKQIEEAITTRLMKLKKDVEVARSEQK